MRAAKETARRMENAAFGGFDGAMLRLVKRLNKIHPQTVRDSKYLTLLSSLKMLRIVVGEVPAAHPAGRLFTHPQRAFNEEELYGC
jgi:hypothetical protein